jgi:hypothetical protein
MTTHQDQDLKQYTQHNRSWFARHKFATGFFILVFAIIIGICVRIAMVNRSNASFQANIEAFYVPPATSPSSAAGALLKSEVMPGVVVPGGGTAYRVLYNTQLANGEAAVSSGVVYVPNTPAPAGGRNVVAWAHGTQGFGDNCVPSRNPTGPLGDTDNWLGSMMQRGWVVTATDYTGLGTPGEPYYLIGQSEAHDVINSVRAARNLPLASAGSKYIAWGHSQGGHSALFTAQLSKSYAPELRLLAVAAAAPAAELNALFSLQYSSSVAWGIGPDAAVSWPLVYNLPLEGVLSKPALRSYKTIAYGCVQKELGEIELRQGIGQRFFETDPNSNIQWYNAAKAQTPQAELAGVPIYVAQGLTDNIVLPPTTALLVQNACSKNVNITTTWLGNTGHVQAAMVAGPAVTNWIADRFSGKPATSNCDQPLPVAPATLPAPPSP